MGIWHQDQTFRSDMGSGIGIRHGDQGLGSGIGIRDWDQELGSWIGIRDWIRDWDQDWDSGSGKMDQGSRIKDPGWESRMGIMNQDCGSGSDFLIKNHDQDL